ncbi:hypothetical protein D1872_345280 [compost metagenome]
MRPAIFVHGAEIARIGIRDESAGTGEGRRRIHVRRQLAALRIDHQIVALAFTQPVVRLRAN